MNGKVLFSLVLRVPGLVLGEPEPEPLAARLESVLTAWGLTPFLQNG